MNDVFMSHYAPPWKLRPEPLRRKHKFLQTPQKEKMLFWQETVGSMQSDREDWERWKYDAGTRNDAYAMSFSVNHGTLSSITFTVRNPSLESKIYKQLSQIRQFAQTVKADSFFPGLFLLLP